jgi:hypothetical protein
MADRLPPASPWGRPLEVGAARSRCQRPIQRKWANTIGIAPRIYARDVFVRSLDFFAEVGFKARLSGGGAIAPHPDILGGFRVRTWKIYTGAEVGYEYQAFPMSKADGLEQALTLNILAGYAL